MNPGGQPHDSAGTVVDQSSCGSLRFSAHPRIHPKFTVDSSVPGRLGPMTYDADVAR
jgi:hypothetical protein